MPFQNKVVLEKDIYAGIVTSLNFHSNSILVVGHGPFLKVYNVQTGHLLASESILSGNRIHRIVFAPHVIYNDNGVEVRRLAVFGSKHLVILQVEITDYKAVIKIEKTLPPFKDWIMDAQWIFDTKTINETQPTKMAIVYAHNNLAIYDFKDADPELLYAVQCEMRCILYSARIYGFTQDDLIVASGTVFNEVHLWKPCVKNEQDDAIVYKKLIGHEGVIFGVRFNDDASQMVSVSDDRTIRIWPLEDETKQPLVLFGHTARVWDCQFVDEYLVSISEDTTCRVWRNTLLVKSEEDDDNNNDCIACWEGHASKNVWSCAVNPEHKIVATGGQDSGIRLWSLASIKNNKIDSEDDLVGFPLPEARGKDTIRNFVVIKNRWLIAATTDGYILKCDNRVLPHEWKEIQYDISYKNYAIMSSSECGRVIVVGNIVGELIILSPTDTFEPVKIAAHKQKLFEIFIKPSSSNQDIFYIISNGYNERVLFHKLDLSTPVPNIQTLFDIEMPVERTTVLSLDYAEEENILICGSRESALLIYRLPYYADISENREIQKVKPTLQLRKSHGKQAITSVLIKRTKENDEIPETEMDNEDIGMDSIIFWTTGRDGCYIQYRLRLLNNHDNKTHIVPVKTTQLGIASQGDTVIVGQDMTLEKLYRNRITKGTLEGSLLLDGELLLMGFFRKNFFVFNEKNNYTMVAISCGGGHRRWGFSTEDAKLNKAAFAFIRKETLYAYFRDTSSITDGFKDSILQNNYHAREVRAIKFLPLSFKGETHRSGEEPLLFATGGEDTIFKIQQYMPEQIPRFYTHVNIRKHTTVIKNIDYSCGISSLLFTSGGLEEFRCWKIEVTPAKSADGLVDLNCLEVSTCPALTEEIESRIMSTTVFAIDAKRGLHVIGAVYSDAMIRFWLFNELTRKFSLVADGTWHAKCILQITHLKLGDHIYFFTSATDGRVAIWDINDNLYKAIDSLDQLEAEPTKAAFRLDEPIYHYRVHMNGVNALEAVAFKDNHHILVLTGGEDNAVSASLMEAQNGAIVPIGQPFIVASAHASSVTGIKFVDNALFSTSTDQRLNMWKVNDLDENGVSLTMQSAIFIDVPDPSTLDAIAFNGYTHVAITGVGLQSIKYPQQN
ncbi:uncharacterized protein BX663DRAFT_503002 [Cokeromyces recurvatus]|uniref:uncharacterized protein n=1 Tax=Cokeromyces recurvatus TaxID=90255 RepID=UPI00221E4430|nr:uncharacterized protein BX663DRAFT_503002 [Cokeromyces recurvatus]KAI7904623.1 hypothetical protein BX663DRAFT_503002 [Cokeromyces recurvatus]